MGQVYPFILFNFFILKNEEETLYIVFKKNLMTKIITEIAHGCSKGRCSEAALRILKRFDDVAHHAAQSQTRAAFFLFALAAQLSISSLYALLFHRQRPIYL